MLFIMMVSALASCKHQVTSTAVGLHLIEILSVVNTVVRSFVLEVELNMADTFIWYVEAFRSLNVLEARVFSISEDHLDSA